MKSLYQLPSLAALVAGSSIALLAAAQAATLDFGPGLTPPPPPGRPQAAFVSTNGGSGPPNTRLEVGMDFEITGNASFDSVNGTFTWDLPNHIFISGYDSNLLVFNTVNLNGGPPPTFTFTGGADSLTATVNLTKVEDTSPVLIGGYTVDSISGSPEFTSNFGAPGSMGNFSWTLNGNGPGSLGALLVSPGGSFIATPTSTGTLTPVGPPSEVPLPPAVYLFGSVLGGAFWLGRKKRNAVSGLSSA